MRRRHIAVVFAIVSALALSSARAQTKAKKTDAEIRKAIIADSIASYRGSCPCPYNRDRAGRNCGARSALQPPKRRLAAVLREGRHPEDGRRLSQGGRPVTSVSLCQW